MRRPGPLSLLVVILVASLPGCGGGDDGTGATPPGNPEALLDAAFANPVRSADTRSELGLELTGSSLLSEPVTVELEGPYVAGDGFPRFDWAGTAAVLGFDVDGELVSTGDNLLVSVYGDGYELGTEEFAAITERLSGARFETRELFAAARYDGREEVDGVETEHVSAELERKMVSEELRPLRDLLGLSDLPAPVGEIGAWIAVDDQVLRKLSIDVAFEIAPEDRARLGDASGGRLKAAVVLDEVNEPQSLPNRPRGIYKPISDLLSSLSDLGAFAN